MFVSNINYSDSSLQSSAREREHTILTSQVLHHRPHLQLRMVRCPRLPLPDTHNRLMGLLGFSQINPGTTNRIRDERLRPRSLHFRLERSLLFPLESSHLPFLLYLQCLHRIHFHDLYCPSGCLLCFQPL